MRDFDERQARAKINELEKAGKQGAGELQGLKAELARHYQSLEDKQKEFMVKISRFCGHTGTSNGFFVLESGKIIEFCSSLQNSEENTFKAAAIVPASEIAELKKLIYEQNIFEKVYKYNHVFDGGHSVEIKLDGKHCLIANEIDFFNKEPTLIARLDNWVKAAVKSKIQ